MSDAIIEIPRTHNPYTTEGVRRDDDGTPHYASLPPSLIDMLRSHVESRRDQEAVVEVDGRRLTYGDLWNRASRVAGGLRARGLNTGDRVAIRYPAGINWVLTFWGTILADAIPAALNKIGRASCRERVEVWGVGRQVNRNRIVCEDNT